MPVKVGCASDYNKNHPDRIGKKRDEETIVSSGEQELWLGRLRQSYYRTGSARRHIR